MRALKLRITITLVVLAFFAGASYGVVPATINYQGMLTDNTGKALTGSYSFVFSLSSGTGGALPTGWSETYSGLTVMNGLYSVQLGSVNNTLGNLPFDTTYYLTIQVGSEILSPAQPLAASPYAFRSKVADSLSGGLSANVIGAGTLPNNVIVTTGSIYATGTASGGTYLDGSGNWSTPSGAGNMTRAVDGLSIANSTSSLQTQINSVGISTGNINTTLLSVQRSTYTMLSISISTGQVTGNWAPNKMQAGTLPNSVVVTTGSIYATGTASGGTYLDGSGNWSTPSGAGNMVRAVDGSNIASSTASLQSQISSVGISTGNINSVLVTVAASTTSLQNQVNSVGLSTGSINTTLLSVQRSTYTMLSISISTGQVTGNWSPSSMQAGTFSNSVIVTTGSIYATGTASGGTYLDGSGNWSTPSGAGNMTRAIDGLNIANSTSSLQTQIGSVGISTGNINTTLLSVQRSTYTMLSISISTGQVTGNWAPNKMQAGTLPNSVVVTTGSIYATGTASGGTYLDGSGNWSTPSGAGNMTRAIDGLNIANSTSSLQTQITSVGISTGNINTTLLSVQQSTYTMLSISISTGQVTGNWAPNKMQAGSLPTNVIASSIAVNSVYPDQVANGTFTGVIISSIQTGSYENIRVGTATIANSLANGNYQLLTSTMAIYSISASSTIAIGGAGFSVTGTTLSIYGTDFVQFFSTVTARALWTPGADLAEIYQSSELLEPGDVVVISESADSSVEKSKNKYDIKVVGAVSTAPGNVMGSGTKGYPIALAGRIPVKVTTENGPIRNGDMLTTSSKPGYAMRASNPKIGAILGKAMESLNSGSGLITVFISIK